MAKKVPGGKGLEKGLTCGDDVSQQQDRESLSQRIYEYMTEADTHGLSYFLLVDIR